MSNDETPDDKIEIRPGMEPLTPEELERFLARARARGHTLTPEEQYAVFGPPPKPKTAAPPPVEVQEAEAAYLDSAQIARLQENFFPELGDAAALPASRLVHGLIFDFDDTLAHLTRPLAQLLEEGAKAAEQYMRSTGMDLPPDFWHSMIEARRFAEEKSEEEQEEHIADDALSFLLQFFGYPASKMNPEVLKRTVEIFYAPEMTAWQLNPGALELLKHLNAEHYKVAIVANYNCDRVFQRTIDYLGLRPYLDVCLSSASVEYRKPDEKIFTPILERWDVMPYEVVVVGDSLLHDIKGGIELGALTVQCTLGANSQVTLDNQQVAEQVKADAVIDDLANLPAIVNAWAGG